jgi:1,4-alpha-glucan branching enzyme
MAHPGKKLLFMGGEFGHFTEWQEWKGLDWQLLDFEMHKRMHMFTEKLLHTYREEPALWEQDNSWQGFQWIDCNDADHSVITFMRRSAGGQAIIVVCNFTPVVRHGYRIGVPQAGSYKELINSDYSLFGGSGQANGALQTENVPWHGREYSVVMTLPPLATVFLKLGR